MWERAVITIGEFYELDFSVGIGRERGFGCGCCTNRAIYCRIVWLDICTVGGSMSMGATMRV